MNIRRWLITIVSCLLVFIALATYKVFEIKAAIAFGESFPEPSATVEAEYLKSKEIDRRISTIGELIAPRTVALRNELEGTIVAVNFRSGARVKKGDVLLQLDISEETAQLAAAEARANLAKLNLDRVKKLLAQRSVNQSQVDQAEADFNVATAQLAGIQALIDKKTITAPFNAKAGLHLFEKGQFLDRNTVITQLLGIDDYYWVDFSLPLSESGVAIGSTIEVSLAHISAEPLTGVIVAKDSVASASSRNLKVRAKLKTDLAIPPNTVVSVNVMLGQQELITIPIVALRSDSLGSYVYLLVDDEKSGAYRGKRQQVTVGKEEGETVAILSGLEVGQLIATHGAFKVRDGLLVYIGEQAPKPEFEATPNVLSTDSPSDAAPVDDESIDTATSGTAE